MLLSREGAVCDFLGIVFDGFSGRIPQTGILLDELGQVAIVERLKASAIEVASLKSANEARLQDLKRISGRVPQLPRF